ncbi:MAG: (d)CMP kinase [Erysipelotrichaceae bacterium]|nr:(d)CMP kinase [Erysipelotrichaceae bacterium]
MAINIAIDGPSASGKSTIAKNLCKKLNYVHLDTGAMYRCVGLAVKRSGIDYNDPEALQNLLDSIDIRLTADEKVFLDGEDVSSAIRTDEISMLASNVSAIGAVREKLVAMQQKMSEAKGFIMDGRDIGSKVLPDAELKIYMTASAEVRAMRRYLENQSRGLESDLQKLTEEIIARDYQDTHRDISPLVCVEDAVVIDTSEMSIDEVVDAIYELVLLKL